jgi:hypothetical protein
VAPVDALRALRVPLLALHKEVLATERRNLERIHGELPGAQFLQIVSDRLRYGWLQPFSELILALDDTLEGVDDDEAEFATPEELLERARDLLLPPKEGTSFGRRYLSLMQSEPALVMAHAAVAKLLRQPA